MFKQRCRESYFLAYKARPHIQEQFDQSFAQEVADTSEFWKEPVEMHG